MDKDAAGDNGMLKQRCFLRLSMSGPIFPTVVFCIVQVKFVDDSGSCLFSLPRNERLLDAMSIAWLTSSAGLNHMLRANVYRPKLLRS